MLERRVVLSYNEEERLNDLLDGVSLRRLQDQVKRAQSLLDKDGIDLQVEVQARRIPYAWVYYASVEYQDRFNEEDYISFSIVVHALPTQSKIIISEHTESACGDGSSDLLVVDTWLDDGGINKLVYVFILDFVLTLLSNIKQHVDDTTAKECSDLCEEIKNIVTILDLLYD